MRNIVHHQTYLPPTIIPHSNDEFQTTSHQHNRPRQGQERRASELLKYTIPTTVTGVLELLSYLNFEIHTPVQNLGNYILQDRYSLVQGGLHATFV